MTGRNGDGAGSLISSDRWPREQKGRRKRRPCAGPGPSRPYSVLVAALSAAAFAAALVFAAHPDVWYLDMGRVLDIWFPHVAVTQSWFTADRDEIVRAMRLEAIHGRPAG